MGRILVAVLLLLSTSVFGQRTIVNSRYIHLELAPEQFSAPSGASKAFGTGQWRKSGALYIDTVGVDSGFYYSGPNGVFHKLAKASDLSGGNGTVAVYDDTCFIITWPNLVKDTVCLTGGGTAAIWGNITGTLSDQTDLQTALDGKVNNTGNETIAGVKTFSSDPLIPDEAYDATAWNGSLEPPTKNAIRDKIETMGSAGWGLTGNSVADGNFLGSTNSRSVVIKSNGTVVAVFDSLQNTCIGCASGVFAASRVSINGGGQVGYALSVDGGATHFGATTSGSFSTYLAGGTWDFFSAPTFESGTGLAIGGFRASQWQHVRLYTDAVERLHVSATEAVFNETGADVDFRVEGDADANLINADAGTDKVGIGKSGASEKLDVAGNVRFSGALMPNNTAGTSGQVLTSAGAGSPPTWTAANTKPTLSKSITVESPSASENISIFYTPIAITITSVADVATGSTPSFTYDIHHHTDRSSGSPNELFGTNRALTSTTGSTTTSFNDATIPAGSWVWIISSAITGTVTTAAVTLVYTED